MKLDISLQIGAANRLAATTRAISKSIQRLSSGQRILSPADDIVGFKSLSWLNSQTRGLTQANFNVNKAQGMLATAEDAISSQMDIVQAMKELALEGANSGLSASNREEINTKLQELLSQFNKIVSSTQFNGMHLLDGSAGTQQLLVGANEGNDLSFELPSLNAGKSFLKTVGNGMSSTTSTFGTVSHSKSAIADFNGDGINDMAAFDSLSPGMSIYLGTGGGKFSHRVTFDAGGGISTATDIIAADMNNDGIQDIVTFFSTKFSIMLGKGDGTFEAAATQANSGGIWIEGDVVDIDSDGDLDLIASNTMTTAIDIFTNDGALGFTETNEAASSIPYDVKLVDINHDGVPDIVEANSGDDSIGIQIGNGDGTFQTLSTFATGDFPYQLQVADFNKDGHIDILNLDYNTGQYSFHAGNGDGTFDARVTGALSVGSTNTDLEVLDFNGDGYLDFVAMDTGADAAQFYQGVGDGTFSLHKVITLANNVNDISVGDIDNDGIDDVTVLSTNSSKYITKILTNTKQMAALPDINVNDVETASKLAEILDDTILALQGERSKLSSVHSRLDIIGAFNLLASDSFEEAKSRINDPDTVLEVTELLRNQILADSQVASYAQANVQLQTVLQLLNF